MPKALDYLRMTTAELHAISTGAPDLDERRIMALDLQRSRGFGCGENPRKSWSTPYYSNGLPFGGGTANPDSSIGYFQNQIFPRNSNHELKQSKVPRSRPVIEINKLNETGRVC